MIKVAAYCRVSTDKEDQANSFETQQLYFRQYIQQMPDWELHEIYADEGITGTSTTKRIQFNRMIQDGYEGRFEILVTKEVSRFSRNILDTISYTRILKKAGVAVVFLTDGINTMEPDAELRLSIMASIAQEESRKTSSRVTWGQTRQMEKGVVFGRSMLGYDVQDGKMSINPAGAEIVRLIFRMYALEQVSTIEIARFLSKEGYRTSRGNIKWTANSIIKTLKNEKYMGDLVQKKSYTPDFLTHEKQKNKGEVPFIHIKNHHEPIISFDVWELAQKRLQDHNKHTSVQVGHSNRYAFSGKIRCGECGASFVSRVKKMQNGSFLRRWVCYTTITEGCSEYDDLQGRHHGCSVGKVIRDDDARNMLKVALKNLSLDFQSIIDDTALLVQDAILSAEANPLENPERLRTEIDRINAKKEDAIDCYLSGTIDRAELNAMKFRYAQQIEKLKMQLNNAEVHKRTNQDTEQIQASIHQELHALLYGDIESEVFYKNILESITVFKDRHIELRLTNLQQVFQFQG